MGDRVVVCDVMGDPFAEYQALLARLDEQRRRLRGSERDGPRGLAGAWRKWVARLGLAAAALCLPFFALVGTAVGLYRHLGLPTWLALVCAVALTAALLISYAVWVWKRLGGRWRWPRYAARTALAVVGAYSIYSLLYLSSYNVKEEALRSRYRSLHPLLRIAASTFVLVDRDLVITDMSREPEDYEAMGLPLYERSLHFIQEDGYAHALDLRTLGRSEWRNRLLQAYFIALGFRTSRHVGTADHLHVSLPPP